MRVICFDTETTGLGEEDEIIQLSIGDPMTGQIIYDGYFRPDDYLMERGWDRAASVNKIYPKVVVNCPSMRDPEIADEIQAIFDSADLVVGFHVAFDVKMMENMGFDMSNYTYQDPQLSYPPYYWTHNPDDHDYGPCTSNWRADAPDGFGHYGRYVGRCLSTAAEELCGITNFGAHNSMNDVNATIAVWQAMREIQEDTYIRGYAYDEDGNIINDDFGNPCYVDDQGLVLIDPNGRAIVYVENYTYDELMEADNCRYISIH